MYRLGRQLGAYIGHRSRADDLQMTLRGQLIPCKCDCLDPLSSAVPNVLEAIQRGPADRERKGRPTVVQRSSISRFGSASPFIHGVRNFRSSSSYPPLTFKQADGVHQPRSPRDYAPPGRGGVVRALRWQMTFEDLLQRVAMRCSWNIMSR